jgi:hypothetical protein
VARKTLDPTLISDEKLQKLNEILATVGLKDPEHWGFDIHIRHRSSFFGGLFEWSERGENMRYYFYARETGPIYKAEVTVLDGRRSYTVYSDEVIAEANRNLAELFGATS